MLEDLKAEFKTIENLERSSTVHFESLKVQVESDTNRQNFNAVVTAEQSLKTLHRFVLFIQESDRKLLSGSSDKALLRHSKAILPRRHREAPSLENTLDEEIQRVIRSFDGTSTAVDAVLESVCQSQELVVDFQHSTILPLKKQIEKFLCTVTDHEQKTAEDIKTQNQQLDEVRDQITKNTGEQHAALVNARIRARDTLRWGVAAGAFSAFIPLVGVVAGVMAINRNDLRKDAERLLESLKERQKDMDEKIAKLKKQVQGLNSVKIDSQRLKRSGKELESTTQSLSQDARDATLEIQCLKERTSKVAQQFSGLRSKAVDPLLYCQTRQHVLEVLDEAFQDIKTLPMTEQMQSITFDVKDRVAELHEADTLIVEWERDRD